MDQVYRIRIMHEYEGKSLRKVAKETGHNFETVKKYVETKDFNYPLSETRRRKGKLTPFEPLIDEWLEKDLEAKPKQRHTAQRVYNRLKEIYGDEFDVSDRSVRNYVARKKRELSGSVEGHLPLDHPPGEAQVDFGEAQFIERGVKYDGHYLNVSYPFSNGGHMQIFKSQNLECLLEGLKSIFDHIGKCPTHLWFDNLSPVVKQIKKNRERDLTQGFERFMLHYRFQSNFCNPDAGHEKGNVEAKVGYHRRNLLVPIPEFSDLREYNKELLKLCDSDMNRDHYQKRKAIADLFVEDKQSMNSLPEVPFEVARLELAKADNYGKIRFDNNIYSSSPALSGQQVWMKANAYEVIILDQNYREIVTHERLHGKGKESMKWLPYLQLMAKRPTALKYTSFFRELPTSLQDYFDKCSYEEKKAGLRTLVRMVTQADLETAVTAFTETLDRGVTDADSLWATYSRLTSEFLEPKEISLPEQVPELKGYIPDVAAYDSLLARGER